MHQRRKASVSETLRRLASAPNVRRMIEQRMVWSCAPARAMSWLRGAGAHQSGLSRTERTHKVRAVSDVRFGAHSGLESDGTALPKRTKSRSAALREDRARPLVDRL